MPLPMHPDAYRIMHEAKSIECNRCGRCCVLPSGRDCRNLRRNPDGTTRCAIWNRVGRIGTPIGEGQVCSLVVWVPRLFEGCPYNELKIKHGIATADEARPPVRG